MKKTLRNKILVILVCVFLFCTCMGMGLFLVGAQSNEREFFVRPGASVRAIDPAGIRFETYFNKNVYDEVVENGQIKSNKTLGTIVVPYSYVEDYQEYIGNEENAYFCEKTSCYYSRDAVEYVEDYGYVSKDYIEDHPSEFIRENGCLLLF